MLVVAEALKESSLEYYMSLPKFVEKTHPNSSLASPSASWISAKSQTISTCSFLLFVVVAVVPASAADDLLDPKTVIRPRHELNAGPTSHGSSNVNNAPRMDSFTWRGNGGYARGMAASVVSSLQGLCGSFNSLHQTLSKLQLAISDFEARRIKLIESKEAEMADYRAGLFCSGCNKTKTQILALREKFPHDGQRIIRPTAEQIAAKDRELQAPIDRLEQELQDARTKRDKADKERQEAELQLQYGYKLWRTAVIFEGRVFYRVGREMAAAYVDTLAAADNQISRLRKELVEADKKFHEALGPRKNEFIRLQSQQQEAEKAHDSERKESEGKIAGLRSQLVKGGAAAENTQILEAQISELAAELAQNVAAHKRDMTALQKHMEKLGIENIKSAYEKLRAELTQEIILWTSKQASLKTQHDENVRRQRESFDASSAARQKEQEQLLALTQTSVPMMKILGLAIYPLTTFLEYWVDHGFFSELGGFYRMGDFQPARHNEVLPSVQRFIDTFRTTWNFRHVSTAAVENEGAPPAENRLIPIQKKLRALLDLPPPPPPR